jgi:hypothetical protein
MFLAASEGDARAKDDSAPTAPAVLLQQRAVRPDTVATTNH